MTSNFFYDVSFPFVLNVFVIIGMSLPISGLETLFETAKLVASIAHARPNVYVAGEQTHSPLSFPLAAFHPAMGQVQLFSSTVKHLQPGSSNASHLL